MKIKVFTILALAAITVVCAQSTSSSSTSDAKMKERERLLSEANRRERSLVIRHQLSAMRLEQNRASRMGGVSYVTPQDKLIVQLAEEVLSLQEETVALRKQVAQLTEK